MDKSLRTRIVQYAVMENATCTIAVAVMHVAQSVLRIRKGAYFNCANSEKVLANMYIAQSETSRKGEKQYMGPQPTTYHTLSGGGLAVF